MNQNSDRSPDSSQQAALGSGNAQTIIHNSYHSPGGIPPEIPPANSSRFKLKAGGLAILLIVSGVFYAYRNTVCKQPFRNPDSAQRIVGACSTILKFRSHDKTALMSRAQAYAVLGDYEKADQDFTQLLSLTPDLDQKDPSKFTSEEREIAFMEAFWPEFMSLVKDNSDVCRSAKITYQKPISAYTSLFPESKEKLNIQESEKLKILELAHFASDRDGEWNLASELYSLILKVDPDSINALFGKAHAHLMSGEDLDTAESFLNKIESEYPRQQEILAKVQYHRGSILARKGNYEDAAAEYSSIISEPNYQGALEKYPLLNYVAHRDKALSLYAAGAFDAAGTAFEKAIGALDEVEDIGTKERNDRESLIIEFQQKSRICNAGASDICGTEDNRLSNLVEYGFVFSHLIAHETYQDEHAFLEEQHEKFYGCFQDAALEQESFSSILLPLEVVFPLSALIPT